MRTPAMLKSADLRCPKGTNAAPGQPSHMLYNNRVSNGFCPAARPAGAAPLCRRVPSLREQAGLGRSRHSRVFVHIAFFSSHFDAKLVDTPLVAAVGAGTAGLPSAGSRHQPCAPSVGRSPPAVQARGRVLVASAAVEELPYFAGGEDDFPSVPQDVDSLNQAFGVPGFVVFSAGVGGLPRVWMAHPNGQGVEIYLQGATITQWTRPDGADLLYVEPAYLFNESKRLRHGLGLTFPQARDEGPMVEGGFASMMQWEVVGVGFDAKPWRRVPKAYLDVIRFRDGPADADKKAKKAAAEQQQQLEQEEQLARAAAAASSGGGGGHYDDRQARCPEYDPAPWETLYYAQLEGEEAQRESADGLSVDVWPPDPAPYVLLRLRDTPLTRDLWPHAFDVTYKVTLMESDEAPEFELPRGRPLDPDDPMGPIHRPMPLDATMRELPRLGTDGELNSDAEPTTRCGRAGGEKVVCGRGGRTVKSQPREGEGG